MNDNDPYRNLWRAVIIQTLQDIMRYREPDTDAFGAPVPERDAALYTPQARAEAARWVLEGGTTLRLVCEMAGVDPMRLQAKARELVNGPQAAAT